MADADVIVPFPRPVPEIPQVTECRGSLIASSLRALEAEGHLPRYFALLPAEHHETIKCLIAGQWLPLSLAITHYEACDRLDLTVDQQVKLGMAVADRLRRTFLATILKLGHHSVVSPWIGLAHFGRLYDRLFMGGGTQVTKVGPKDARIEMVGSPLARIGYYRNAYRGVIRGGCELFCSTAYVTLIPKLCSDTTLGYRAAWA